MRHDDQPPAPAAAQAPDGDHSADDKPSPRAREVVRASPDLAPTVTSLLAALYPQTDQYSVGAVQVRLILDPAPPLSSQLRRLLHELVDRPEWRARHAVVREVTDSQGERFEVLTPVAPHDYRAGNGSGALLVGPFDSENAADEWGADHAIATLSYDTFFTGSVWLCDLFELPEGQ